MMNRLPGIAHLLGIASLGMACGESGPERDGSEVVPGNGDALPPAASAALPLPQIPTIEWTSCNDGFECARVEVPRDYADPEGPSLSLAVTRLTARDPTRRIGSLFINFGGPGVQVVSALQGGAAAFYGGMYQRFDIIGFDPRGVGQTEGAIDCELDQESAGLYAQPFTTPDNLDRDALRQRAQALVDACVSKSSDSLAYASTTSGARDMDLLRAALGEEKLSYLGFSYGTLLGATYASLFPQNYRALVLDGAFDLDQTLHRPMQSYLDQSAAFERVLARFFESCAANQSVCSNFGGSDPGAAFDALVARANQTPIPVRNSTRAVDGDDILVSTYDALLRKSNWRPFAGALAAAQAGDGAEIRALTDASYDRNADGNYGPSLDRFFVLSAVEQTYDADGERFVQGGERSWQVAPHFWWNSGYVELPFGLWPIRAQNVFRGPFQVPMDAATVLVLGTTFDPATPYEEAVGLVEQLGNASLLTINGDGHTAYRDTSACINLAMKSYLEDVTVPAPGTECDQDVPF